MERRYFVIRQDTAPSIRAALQEESQKGRIRQGWGLAGLDLHREREEWIGAYIAAFRADAFEPGRADAEKRYSILTPLLKIRDGDRIIVPKQPTMGIS